MKQRMKDRIGAALRRVGSIGGGYRPKNHWVVTCRGPDGDIKWADEFKNITVNEGLDDILDKYWKGSTYSATHYVGLTDSAPTVAAGDTMSSHSGWAEDQTYSEANRQTLTLGSVSGQSVDNTASKASFSINGSTTIGGAFVSTDNTKGGTSGTLIVVSAFSGGDRTVADGDTIDVTVTLTASDA